MKRGRKNGKTVAWRLPFAVQFFLVLTLFVGVPLALFGFWASQHRMERAEQQFDQLGLQHATDARDALLSIIGLKEEVLSVVAATADTIPDWNEESLQPLVDKQLLASGSFDALVISDRDGTSVAFAPSIRPDGSTTSAGVSYRDRQYYKDLIQTQATSYGPLVRGKQSRVPNIHVAVPIFHGEVAAGEDRLRGFVTGSIRTSLLQEVALRALPATEGWRVLIIDNADQVVVDSHSKIPSMGPASQLPYSKLDCNAAGVDVADESGLLYRAACAPMSLGAQNWSVWISAPHHLIDAQAAEARNTVFQATLLTWLCALALSALASVQSGRWATRLTHLAGQLGGGEFEIPIPATSWHHPKEAEDLRDILVQTLGRLRDNDAQVKALVDALTAVNKQLQPYAEAWAEVTDSIEILDGNAIVMFVNPAFATLTGRQSGVVGCPSPLQTPYGDGDGTVPDLLKRAREGQPWQAYLKVEVNGTDRNHEVHLTPILDDNGTLLRIIAIRSDVTEVRRAQAAVNYNERLVALGTLAAGLAHEINNPLTYIRTSLEMIAEQRAGLQDQPGSKQSVTDALDGVEIVARIVRDMLSLARSHEATAPRTPLGTVDLTEIVWATLNLLTPSTRGAVNIEVASQASPLTFHGRRHDAIQLILNLIRNAVQALETTPLQDSQISIRSGRDRANEIWLEIIDNGPGIDPTKLERIFEPFYTSKNVGKGAGLGLSTSRSLIADMGGSLDVSSRPGHTCFRATFVASKPEKQQPSSSEPSQSEDARILVIDDDPRVARGIKLMLRRHKVTLAEDGPTALTLVKNHVYDLIICDVMMPIMDGPTVYENIKSVDPRASEKLVFLTGAATSVDTRSALGRTGRQILAKPTNRRQLEQLVSEFHRPPPMSP